jgi:hypothetical protein
MLAHAADLRRLILALHKKIRSVPWDAERRTVSIKVFTSRTGTGSDEIFELKSSNAGVFGAL